MENLTFCVVGNVLHHSALSDWLKIQNDFSELFFIYLFVLTGSGVLIL